jgi:hypothetical protein
MEALLANINAKELPCQTIWDLSLEIVEDVIRAFNTAPNYEIVVFAVTPPDADRIIDRVVNALRTQSIVIGDSIIKQNRKEVWFQQTVEPDAVLKLRWYGNTSKRIKGISASTIYADATFMSNEEFVADVVEPLAKVTAVELKYAPDV